MNKVYYKNYKYWELLHLYEHILIYEFWFRMNNLGFFCYKDYLISGSVESSSSVMEISIKTNILGVLEKFREFTNQPLKLEDWEIEKYANQIFAEEQSWLFRDRYRIGEIKKYLDEIHSRELFSEVPHESFEKIEALFFSSGYKSRPRNRRQILRILISGNRTKQDFIGENLLKFICFNFGFYNFRRKGYLDLEESYLSIGNYDYREILQDFDSKIIKGIVDFLREDFSAEIKEEYFEDTKLTIYFNHKKRVICLKDCF